MSGVSWLTSTVAFVCETHRAVVVVVVPSCFLLCFFVFYSNRRKHFLPSLHARRTYILLSSTLHAQPGLRIHFTSLHGRASLITHTCISPVYIHTLTSLPTHARRTTHDAHGYNDQSPIERRINYTQSAIPFNCLFPDLTNQPTKTNKQARISRVSNDTSTVHHT